MTLTHHPDIPPVGEPGPDWATALVGVLDDITSQGNLADLPAPGAPDSALFWSDDTHQMFRSDGDDWHELLALAPSNTDYGLHRNTSATYGSWFTIGNAGGSIGFAGTGSPAEGFGALAVYQKFGEANPGDDIEHTTQAMYVLASYYGPTVDDSAEGFSCFVGLKDIGGDGPIVQTKPLTGGESIAQIEGNNHHAGNFTNPMLGWGSRVNVLGTSTVDHAEGFRASTTKDAGATLTEYVAFSQPQSAPTALATKRFGVRVADPIVGFTSVVVDGSVLGGTGLFKADVAGSGGGNSAFLYVEPPTSPDLIAMRVQQAAGSNVDLAEWWLAGGSSPIVSITRLGIAISKGKSWDVQSSAGAGLVRIGQVGLEYLSNTLEQTTVGGAGGASALPASPTKYFKVKDSAGTVLVIPAFAAS